MNAKDIATPKRRSRKRFPARICACGCGRKFTPVVEHQKYISVSHRVFAFNQRKFERAVEAEVQERLKRRAAGAESGS